MSEPSVVNFNSPIIVPDGCSLRVAVQVVKDGRVSTVGVMAVPVAGVHATVQGISVQAITLLPKQLARWQTVEDIAAVVRGFSDDPICSVVADRVLALHAESMSSLVEVAPVVSPDTDPIEVWRRALLEALDYGTSEARRGQLRDMAAGYRTAATP